MALLNYPWSLFCPLFLLLVLSYLQSCQERKKKMVSHSLLTFSPLPVLQIGKTKSEACPRCAIHIDFSLLMQNNVPRGYTESAEFRGGSTNLIQVPIIVDPFLFLFLDPASPGLKLAM